MAEYIEREAARTLIKNFGKDAIRDGKRALDPVDDIILLASGVDLIPAVDVAPVRNSFWECYETSAYGGFKDGDVRWLSRKFYRCERCRKGSAIKSNYCPNCGAKMDGAEKDE